MITGQAKADKISLHQKDLTIETVEVAGQARPFTVDDANEAVYVELESTGQVTVTLTYSGKITDNMTGIYPSYYSIDGVKKESFQLSLRAILRVKPFQVWTSLKPKQRLIFL